MRKRKTTEQHARRAKATRKKKLKHKAGRRTAKTTRKKTAAPKVRPGSAKTARKRLSAAGRAVCNCARRASATLSCCDVPGDFAT